MASLCGGLTADVQKACRILQRLEEPLQGGGSSKSHLRPPVCPPVKQAFRTLLGDMSYSLEWEEKTGQLVGVTILAGGDGAAVANVSAIPSHTQRVEHEARMVEERAVQEERMKEQMARHDAEVEAELAAEGLIPPR
jgi:hypothetical protein